MISDPNPPGRDSPDPSPAGAAIPQGNAPAPEKAARLPQAEARSGISGEGHSGLSYPVPPRIDKQGEVTTVSKPKRWPLLLVAAVMIAAALAGVVGTNHSPAPGGTTPPIALEHHDHILTVTGADADRAETDRAIAELKGGAPEPRLAALPDSVKKQLLDGEREFYRLPPSVPRDMPPARAGDKISVDFNGVPYGTYDLSKPISVDMPLAIGDRVGIHCISLAPGKSSVTVDVATVLNPVRTPALAAGDSDSLDVESGAAGQNYDWFEREAQLGNPVAEYGLGHMYQYGLGVTQDKATALHWYGLAASQNYLDAKAQLQLLQSTP